MRRRWWWAVGAAALLALAALATTPMQPRSVRPNPISERRVPERSTVPGTPIRGGDVRAPGDRAGGTQTQPDPESRINMRARSAAASVDGVRDAWAVVTNKAGAPRASVKDTAAALVGVTLESSLTGAAKQDTLNEVKAAVKKVPYIDKVAVTSSPTMVARIRRVAEDIAAGKTSDTFNNDLSTITREMLPAAK